MCDWSLDEMYTEAAVDGLDTDQDGTYSAAELQPLTKENLDSLKEFFYFPNMRVDGKKVAFNDPTDARQHWASKRLTLHFQSVSITTDR